MPAKLGSAKKMEYIHCTRCNFDVRTHDYGQHLFDHARGHEDDGNGPRGLEKHKIDDSRCLAKTRGYTGKNPAMKGQRKRARAALLKALKEHEAKKQEEARKKKEAENRERAKKEAKELSKAVAEARSQGSPYSSLAINKGKKWKGGTHFVPGGLPGSKR
jgi:hypothetical protein